MILRVKHVVREYCEREYEYVYILLELECAVNQGSVVNHTCTATTKT